VTSELCTAECRKGTPLELSTGSHRHESVVQSHIWNEARTAVVGESFILCQNYVCVCTHVGTCLCTYFSPVFSCVNLLCCGQVSSSDTDCGLQKRNCTPYVQWTLQPVMFRVSWNVFSECASAVVVAMT